MTLYEWGWLFALPGLLMSWFHILRHGWRFVTPSPEFLPPSPARIIFLIAARETSALVQQSVDAIHKACADVAFNNYEVMATVQRVPMGLRGIKVIQVPESFTCKSQFKARQLQYALRYLPDSKDAWTLHLDEDALVTSHCVYSILSYIAKGGKPVANGPSVFPDKNPLMLVAETNRQWTFYWLKDQLLSGRPFWLNGSNLLIRSDVEQQVGWDSGASFGEDSRFGLIGWKKLGNIFGWHGGLVIEAAPSNITGLFRQRRRWYRSSWLNLKEVPLRWWPRRIYSVLGWNMGFILALAFWASPTPVFETWGVLVWLMLPSAILWQARYQQGIYWNLKYGSFSNAKKLWYHLLAIPLAPVADVLCGMPTWWSAMNPPRTFEITSKKAWEVAK